MIQLANFTPQELEEILQQFFDVVGKRQYIGARYVPIFGRKGEDTIQWDGGVAPYEPLTIVLYQGDSYTSRTYVPAGIDILNQQYWALTGNYNAQIEAYREEVLGFNDRITANANDIDALEGMLPSANFDATNTVKKYVDDAGSQLQNNIDALGGVLPSASFDSTNTVKKYVDDAVKNVCRAFENVAEMQLAENLEKGLVCKTNGFTDGEVGGAWYVLEEDLTPNGYNIIEYDSDLSFRLLYDDSIDVTQIGCPNNSNTDVSDYFDKAFELSDDVYVPSGTYIVENIQMPKNGHLHGDQNYFAGLAGASTNNAGTILCQNTTNPCILTNHRTVINNLKFKSDITYAVDEDTMSADCDYVIFGSSAFDVEIYNIGLLGVNRGIGFNNTSGVFNSIGILNIHDIYGSVYTTLLRIYGASDFVQVTNVNITVQSAITFDARSADFKYVRKHMTGLDLGRTDYSVFDNVKIFVGRYFVRFKHDDSIPSTPRGSHNILFSNLEADSVGTAIYTPLSANQAVIEGSFCNCVFTNGIAGAFSPTTYAENAAYGNAIIDVNDSSNIQVNSCVFSGIATNVISAKNGANLKVSNCFIRDFDALNPTDYVAFLVSESSFVSITNCNVLQLSAKQNSGLISSNGLGYVFFYENFFNYLTVNSSAEYVKGNITYKNNQFSSGTMPVATDYHTFLTSWNLPDHRLDNMLLVSSALTENQSYSIPMHKTFLSKFKSVLISVNRWGFGITQEIAVQQILEGGYSNFVIVGSLGSTATNLTCNFDATNDNIVLNCNQPVFARMLLKE